jgi:hypothetical protein
MLLKIIACVIVGSVIGYVGGILVRDYRFGSRSFALFN